jgi:hypothetical protein
MNIYYVYPAHKGFRLIAKHLANKDLEILHGILQNQTDVCSLTRVNCSQKEQTKSESHKAKLSDIAKQKQKHSCIHCGKISILTNINRWHNDNCKLVQEIHVQSHQGCVTHSV